MKRLMLGIMCLVSFVMCGCASVPTGSIVAYHGTGTPPTGWLLCDGTYVPAGENYANLRRICKKTPDLKGMFLRGAGQNENKEFHYTQGTPRLVGSTQKDATARPENNFWADLKHAHKHGRAIAGPVRAGGTQEPRNNDGGATTGFALSDKHNTSKGGGDRETRPNNYAVNFIIKAF